MVGILCTRLCIWSIITLYFSENNSLEVRLILMTNRNEYKYAWVFKDFRKNISQTQMFALNDNRFYLSLILYNYSIIFSISAAVFVDYIFRAVWIAYVKMWSKDLTMLINERFCPSANLLHIHELLCNVYIVRIKSMIEYHCMWMIYHIISIYSLYSGWWNDFN